MFSKNKTTVLLVVLVALLAVFLVLKYSDNSDRTIPETLVEADTARIDHITIRLPKNGGEVELRKTDGLWRVEENGRFFRADQQLVRKLLGDLTELKPRSLAATEESQWEKLQVNDSLGTRVRLLQGNDIAGELILGKISISQPKNQNPYMRQQQEVLMYARPAGQPQVYLTDGMLKLQMGSGPSDFRYKLFCKTDTKDIRKLEFDYPAGESFTLEKKENRWFVGEQRADSAVTERYLRKFSYSRGNGFDDNFIPGNRQYFGKITVDRGKEEPVVLTAWLVDSVRFVVHSSLNPDSYFDGESAKLLENFFVQKDHFLPLKAGEK